MESGRTKQQQNKNAVLVNCTIFKLVESIEKKIKAGHTDKDLEELKVLREQCGSDQPLVSVTACHGLVHLVKSYLFPLSNTVSALVASLFSVKNVTGVTSALTELLILELQTQLATEAAYVCPYNTKSPQHPLVSVLKRRPHSWPDVLNQISFICSHSDKQVQNRSLELVKPVLSFILLETNDLPYSCKLQVFRILVTHFPASEYLIEALASCLCWEGGNMLEALQAVTSVSQWACSNSGSDSPLVPVSCFALTSLVPRLLQDGHSPTPALRLLSQLAPRAANTHSTMVTMLASSILSCPAIHLGHLLSFFVELLKKGQCSQDCTWMCVTALLPWLASESTHLHSALQTASLIMDHASTSTSNATTTASLISSTAVGTVVSADPRLTEAIHIARLSEVLRGDVQATLQWLRSLQSVESEQMYLYVSALMVSHCEKEVRLASLQVLVASFATCPAAAHSLTLLLYQLAREKDPEIQLALLRALPTTAVDKNNVMGVISTLEALRQSGRRHLTLLAVDLYSQLWEHQERCYPQLIDALNQDHISDEPVLAHILQANICKAICTTKAEKHGKEVVALVSNILNKCGGAKESVASALALEALIPLCRHDVVDVYSIWRSLSPRFSRDKRPLVLKSLCELVSVAALQKGNSEADETLSLMLKWLWNLVATSKDATVVNESLKALSKFRLDVMTLKMLPECFRKGIKLPPEMTKTPVDAARKPEDVLTYIPGDCWVQIIQHLNSISASHAIAAWIKVEVASFAGGLYQVDRQEPASYAHLSQSSVVRGVTTSLQQLWKTRSADDINTIILCLEALAQPSHKPLPSLSWAFLGDPSELDNTNLIHNVVRLAAKQSQISPSSRKITESFMAKNENNLEEIEFLYSILGSLCRGIPPNLLRPFLEKTLHSAIKQNNNKHFSLLLAYIKSTLKEEKIHDANRTLLHQQLKFMWDVLEPQHELLNEYFECASELPVSVIESMTSTTLMWEVTSAQLQKAFRLRSFMALLLNASSPFNWINEVIEVASTNISEQSLALSLVADVVSKLRKHTAVWPWLLELMGQTHQISVSNKNGLDFLIIVFVLCVDIVSGYSHLATGSNDSRTLRFPQAVILLVNQHGEAKTMLEWLNHIMDVDNFPTEYSNHFQLAARNVSLILK